MRLQFGISARVVIYHKYRTLLEARYAEQEETLMLAKVASGLEPDGQPVIATIKRHKESLLLELGWHHPYPA